MTPDLSPSLPTLINNFYTAIQPLKSACFSLTCIMGKNIIRLHFLQASCYLEHSTNNIYFDYITSANAGLMLTLAIYFKFTNTVNTN